MISVILSSFDRETKEIVNEIDRYLAGRGRYIYYSREYTVVSHVAISRSKKDVSRWEEDTKRILSKYPSIREIINKISTLIKYPRDFIVTMLELPDIEIKLLFTPTTMTLFYDISGVFCRLNSDRVVIINVLPIGREGASIVRTLFHEVMHYYQDYKYNISHRVWAVATVDEEAAYYFYSKVENVVDQFVQVVAPLYCREHPSICDELNNLCIKAYKIFKEKLSEEYSFF